MLRSSTPHPNRLPGRRRATALIVAVVGGAGGLTACGDDDGPKKAPAGPRLTAKQNKGVADIGREVSKYCFQGGAKGDIEREVQGLLVAYRAHPTATFEGPDGTKSKMRQVVAAVADQLEACGETSAAKPLRAELRRAG